MRRDIVLEVDLHVDSKEDAGLWVWERRLLV